MEHRRDNEGGKQPSAAGAIAAAAAAVAAAAAATAKAAQAAAAAAATAAQTAAIAASTIADQDVTASAMSADEAADNAVFAAQAAAEAAAAATHAAAEAAASVKNAAAAASVSAAPLDSRAVFSIDVRSNAPVVTVSNAPFVIPNAAHEDAPECAVVPAAAVVPDEIPVNAPANPPNGGLNALRTSSARMEVSIAQFMGNNGPAAGVSRPGNMSPMANPELFGLLNNCGPPPKLPKPDLGDH